MLLRATKREFTAKAQGWGLTQRVEAGCVQRRLRDLTCSRV